MSGPLVCERKFTAEGPVLQVALDLFSCYAIPDSKFPFGEIESVYFDSPELSSYYEKANGDSLKRKVRIRWYRTGAKSGMCKAFLEIKDRIGAAREKFRHNFTADIKFLESSRLDDSEWVSMLSRNISSAGFSIPQPLFPTVSIRYARWRFICPYTASRLAVDSNLECPRANPLFFQNPHRLESNMTVCEAKSAEVRNWIWCDSLFRSGFRPESFSKYGYFVGRQLNGGC